MRKVQCQGVLEGWKAHGRVVTDSVDEKKVAKYGTHAMPARETRMQVD